MLRIVHTADVHLGARHADLGDQAAAQRERQFAAFKATVDLAIAEKVDLFLIAGRPVRQNTQPRRSVERVAAQLAPLAAAKIRTVIIPGTHDVYDRSSIYRAYDLEALAGSDADDDLVTVLTPAHPWVHLTACDVVVFGPVFATKKAPKSPLQDLDAAVVRRGDLAGRDGPRRGRDPRQDRPRRRRDHDRTRSPRAASTTSRSGTGTRPSRRRAGGVTYAYAGAPESVAIDQDRAGKVLLVELDTKAGAKTVTVTEQQVGKTQLRQGPASTPRRSPASRPSSKASRSAATPTSSSTCASIGVRPDELDLHLDEIETALAPSFLQIRVRDASHAGAHRGRSAVAGHDRGFVHPRPRGVASPSSRRRRHGTERGRRGCATPCGSAGCSSPGTR